jgi:predicted RNA binding protein YcfA (HicA-like mRNA interferase family)
LNARGILERILSGSKNIKFEEVVILAKAYGFRLTRINGSHHIFIHPEVRELINLQSVNGMAKPYQIKQLLKLVEINSLRLGG